MKLWLKILIALFLIGVVTAVLVYVFVYNKPHPDYENLKADHTLTAQDLYRKFSTNPGEANTLYLGKMIEISGQLTRIETTDSLVTAVFVFEEGDFGDMGLRCTMLQKYNEEAKKLKPDGNVRIKGYCTGYNEGSDVIMEQCSMNF